ncbi:uncharacterized protein si:dkey-28a3.2 [Esox lucius]|uniref:uncharacterized protein si:dkey-28a3.2 n=1 Tax=Esox lucius TaxID=8010 RepID=UPI001476A7FB|nr:uncharacterized protein si:dkey-28a3.2 [Esox lucius]XP_028973293.2 uncharacterized protein si:dkey-28a3.2 [Esox lucius]
MPTTKGTGAPGSPRGQRYRPASEFDDATLAQKREYWRNKKREQRAKLSEVKRERSKAANRGSKSSGGNVVVNSVPFNSSGSCSMTRSAPPLLNSDGSYQNDVCGAPVVLLKGKGSAVSYHQNYTVGEGEQNSSSANQKERWFQRIKLNKVLPQFQTSGADQEKGAMVCQMVVKSSPTGDAVIGDVTSAKPNGVLLNCGSSASPGSVATRPSGSAPGKLQGGVTLLNGSSSVVSTEPHLATPGESTPDASTNAVHVQHRPLTANSATGTSQSTPNLIHKPGGRPRGMKVTPLVGKNSALAAAQGVRSINDTPASLETEEERAAKRRENWRIKKREQRAKQAASLKKASERIRSMDVSLQKAPQLPSMVVARPPSALTGQGQRQCVNRARAPFTSAGRLLKNARAVATVAVKRESEDSTLAKLAAVDANGPTVQLKLQNLQEANATMQTRIASNIIGYKPAGEPITSLPGPVPFANTSRGLVRCRTPRQRFIETQRNLLGQRNMRKFPCHAAAFTAHSAPQDDPMETPEQLAARKREYWRVKKREQRAKLSVEVRAKMKERDGLLRRVKRYQSILEDMRKARVAGCNTLSQPPGNRPTHTSASETIGGFIKEDGTLTNKIPQIDLTTEVKDTGGMRVNNSFANTHHQHQLLPNVPGDASSNVLLSHPIRVNPPPLIRPAQVKVSCPPIGLSLAKPPRLVSIKPRTDFRAAPNSHPVIQPQSHITLTHPQNTQNPFPGVPKAMPHSASCVMKMAVKTSNVSTVLNLDPKLTEEERMAKKREYWRVKKREQRAARANRLRQGAQARGNAASQKRRNQRLARLSTASPNVNNSVNNMPTIKPLSNTSVSVPPQGHNIKQERDSTSVDPPCPLQELECVDVKPPPPPPPPPPEPQLSEPADLALSADSQATTLLAVASMKKLLEESLSTVADCKTEQPDCMAEQLPCKTEPQAYPSEEAHVQMEVKPNLPLLTLGDEEKVSLSADLSLEVKGWQVDADSLPPCQVAFHPLSPNPKYSPLSNGTETPCFPAPAHEPQSHSPVHSHAAASGEPLLPYPRRAQRLRDKKTGHHHCCSPEPPKLHHHAPQQQQQQQPPPRQQDQYQLLQHQQTTRQQQQHHHAPAAADHSVTLQKREYWRIMKRQQRARKARQGGGGLRQGDYSRRLALKAAQAPSLFIVKTQTQRPGQKSGSFSLQAPPLLSPQPSPLLRPISPPASGPQETHCAVPNVPSLLVVSPTRSDTGHRSDALQLRPLVNYAAISRSPTGHTDSPQTSHGFSTVSLPVEEEVDGPPLGEGKNGGLLLVESQPEAVPGSSPDSPRVRKWRLQVQETADADTSPIATLSPPPNPLTSIKLLPIHPPSQASSFTPTQAPFIRHSAEICQSGSDQNVQSSSTQGLVKSPIYVSSMGPPKPVPGESEEETLRKKREYWRVKKKEQRARKAMRDRELTEKRASVNWRPILPTGQTDLLHGMDTQEQDPDHWLNTAEDSELLLSTSTETDMGYFPDSSHMEPLEDESELLHPDDGTGDGYNAPFSDTVWRNRYLMDYDPLNQLLVCMVCGDLQYSHSLEGVRAHIEDAHPDTLSLDAPEHHRILEAWDEQVSRRERFFTSQLQQHSGAMGVDSASLPAEVEVMVDTEEAAYAANSKSSKAKPTRRL